MIKNKSAENLIRKRDIFVTEMLTKIHTREGEFATKKPHVKPKNELEFMVGQDTATEGNLELPNLNGVDSRDFSQEGYLTMLKGGRDITNAITKRSVNKISLQHI